MPDILPLRNVRDAEIDYFGENHVATIVIDSDRHANMTPSDINLDQALRGLLTSQMTLLWIHSYHHSVAGVTNTITFGYDLEIGEERIGHAALTTQATMAGEIYREGNSWIIDDNSGAWGDMGTRRKASAALINVALLMNQYCGLHVRATSTAFTR